MTENLKIEKSFDYSPGHHEWFPWVKVTFPAVPANEHDSPVWKQRDELATSLASIAADRAATAPEPQNEQLMKFYGVSTTQALIDAQAHHIERLQAKLPATPSLAPTFPRG